MAPLRRRRVAAAGEHEEVTLRVLRDADRFADGVARDGQPKHFLGDLELRRGFLERGLLGLLLGRAGQPAAGGGAAGACAAGAGPPSLFCAAGSLHAAIPAASATATIMRIFMARSPRGLITGSRIDARVYAFFRSRGAAWLAGLDGLG